MEKCVNYAENKLDYAEKLQQLTKLIITLSKCSEQQRNEKHLKVLSTI